MQKLFMAWPTSTLWQPLHNVTQKSPYLEEHTSSFTAHKLPRGNPTDFSIKTKEFGAWTFNLGVKTCQAGSAKLLSHASQFRGESSREDQKMLHYSKTWYFSPRKLWVGKVHIPSWNLAQG